MRPWNNASKTLLTATALAILAGCGGGSSVTSGNSLIKSNNPPVAKLVGWTPANPLPLVRYRAYTFTASATDPDLGDTISQYEWDFGDGTATRTTTAPTISHAYTTGGAVVSAAARVRGNVGTTSTSSGSFTFRVRAYDNHGLHGDWASTTLPVDDTASPITATFLSPAAAETVQASVGGSVQVAFKIQVDSTSGGVIGLSNVVFSTNDANSSILNSKDNGDGTYTYIVSYGGQSATRTSTPTVSVTDSLGITSGVVSGPAITITSSATSDHLPVIVVTTPQSPITGAFTSKPVDLVFTLTDADGDVVSYTVDWGDGTTDLGATSGDTKAGVSVALTHTFPDTFTSTSKPAVATITAFDGRASGTVPQTRTFTVAYNSYPTATITSPQASGTLPTTDELPSNAAIGLVNPPGSGDPDIVVVPLNSKLAFAGTATIPSSQDAALNYSWTFQGGVPATSKDAVPGDVSFPGNAGVITPCLVTLTVTDAFGRPSTGLDSSGKAIPGAPTVNAKTYKKWVVVDGTHTQLFKLGFMYRLKSDNFGTSSLAPIATSANGLGASVQIFQDGLSNTYQVQDASGTQAQVAIPVRSNLPFYIKIPNYNSTDTRNYLMRIPNAPTGAFADPSLGTVVDSKASSFGFENADAPWNPTLQIVTAQGFAAEKAAAPERRMQGRVVPVLGKLPVNERWLDRLSIPLNDTDSLGALNQWVQSSNAMGGMVGIRANQLFAEWPMILMTQKPADLLPAESPVDPTTAAGKSSELGFVLDYSKYTGDTQKSDTSVASMWQAFRVPGSKLDPYDLDVAGWMSSSTVVNLNPKAMGSAIQAFFQQSVYGVPGTAPLAGGLEGLSIPYDANDPDHVPLALPTTRYFGYFRDTFSYSEYLWSTVWARPLVLNNARLSWIDYPAAFSYFRNSNPTAWPTYSGITPDKSAFDLTAAPGGSFDASSPVALAPNKPSNTGVGHFYWTAYTPFYNAVGGAAISRTWLADPTGLPPTSFAGQSAGDATSAFGFVPPQDTMVDKRGRNADGSLNGSSLGGYRVTWFNATKDANQDPVAPDFWVVEFATQSGTYHYLLAPSFPAGSQKLTDAIMTDARTFLPSGRSASQGPATDGAGKVTDSVAPGYCWFDVPVELRADSLHPELNSAITVFGVKAILRNNAVAGARALNRPEWMDAIKTASATIKLLSSGGVDLAYAHKIPFNYAWDIVVVNGARTIVAP